MNFKATTNFFNFFCLKIWAPLQKGERGGGDFVFNDINFRGMLHNVCDVVYHKKCVDQSELVNVGEQID